LCSFAVWLESHKNRLPIDRSAETLLLVAEGNRAVVWREVIRVSTELANVAPR
jgi:hypothetical protein